MSNIDDINDIEKNKKLVKKWSKSGIKQSSKIVPIIDKDNWAIIDNSIIGFPFQSPFGCSGTINSHCSTYKKAKTVKQCMEICKKDPLCDIGNFITMNGKSLCLPYAHTSELDPQMDSSVWNLYDNYQTKNIKSQSFLNYNKYSPTKPFDLSIYFNDKFAIKSTTFDNYIGRTTDNNTKNFYTKTQINFVSAGQETSISSIKIKNYYNVGINISKTYLLLNANDKCEDEDSSKCNDLSWINSLHSRQGKESTFRIICLSKSPHEAIDYNDEFVFLSHDKRYLCVDGKNIFLKEYSFLNKNKKFKYKFSLVPLFDVSYCNNSIDATELSNINDIKSVPTCINISIDNCIEKNKNFYYIDPKTNEQKLVFRSTTCNELCKNDGIIEHGREIQLKTDTQRKIIITDQLIIAISIIIISFTLFTLLK